MCHSIRCVENEEGARYVKSAHRASLVRREPMSLSQYISRTIAVLMTSVMNKQNLFGMVKAISKAKVGDNSPCAGPLIRYVIVGHRACGYNDLHSRSSLARSEEHTSELQSLMRISYAVLCLKNNKTT